jgi:hypothetical protein
MLCSPLTTHLARVTQHGPQDFIQQFIRDAATIFQVPSAAPEQLIAQVWGRVPHSPGVMLGHVRLRCGHQGHARQDDSGCISSFPLQHVEIGHCLKAIKAEINIGSQEIVCRQALSFVHSIATGWRPVNAAASQEPTLVKSAPLSEATWYVMSDLMF